MTEILIEYLLKAMLIVFCIISVLTLLKFIQKEEQYLESTNTGTEPEQFLSDFQKDLQSIRATVPENLIDQYILQQREVTLLYNKGIVTRQAAITTLTNWLRTQTNG